MLLLPLALRAENLVHNGDFELDSPDRPPAGWAMWGAKQYKDPANYTRDTADPHGGKACFRIRHPADTAGYIVTDPAHAIQAGKGMAYRISFWARTDKPGTTVFYLEAYTSVQPFREAASPGRWPIRVEKQWRQFTFEIHDGRDFLIPAGGRLLLMLAFRTTLDKAEEKTLWLDDVAVTASRGEQAAGLIDPATLKVAPLAHRVRPGKELSLTIDAGRRLREATRLAGGVSFHRVAGWGRHPYDRQGKYILEPALEEKVRQMRLPMTRFYAVGDEPFGLTGALDRAADLCRRMNIPQQTTVLELETQSAATKLPPEVWAKAAGYCAAKGYCFNRWEISNEPYTRKAEAFGTPEAYLAHFRAVAAAIRNAQPGARIGLPIHAESQAWGNYVLKAAAGQYDFVVGHYYSSADAYRLPLEDVVLTANYAILGKIQQANALIAAYNAGGREVCQLDTEWGLACDGPKGEDPEDVRRNSNIVGTLHRAVRLIYYAREGMLRGASGWEMFCHPRQPGFGILSRDVPDQALLLYWLYYHFNRSVGRWVVEVDGTAPFHTPADQAAGPAGPLTPVLASLAEDARTLYVVIANGSRSAAVPCRVVVRNFAAASASGVVLSQADLDASPVVKDPSDAISPLKLTGPAGGTIAWNLPPHSVAFLTIAAGAD